MLKPDELSADQLLRIVRRSMVDPTLDHSEHRRSPRFSVQVAVACRCLNDQFQPLGESIDATALNISASGIQFVNQQQAHTSKVLLTFRDEGGTPIEMMVEIVRRGKHGKHHVTAGRFMQPE